MFFKRFFLLAGVMVLLMQVDFSDRVAAGISEYYSLTLLALAGMMFTASAASFAVMFVSLEVVSAWPSSMAPPARSLSWTSCRIRRI
jgi:NADH:ubiquinone oxidoreductase subunit 2 (subunit N)